MPRAELFDSTAAHRLAIEFAEDYETCKRLEFVAHLVRTGRLTEPTRDEWLALRALEVEGGI